MKRTKILVTGAAGLLGSNFCKHFLRKNFIVYGLDRKYLNIKNKNFFFYKKSIKKFFSETKQKFDYIFHTAAISKNNFSYTFPNETLNENISNLLEIVKYLKKNNKSNLFFFSTKQIETDFKNFNILHPYALSKKTGEDILKYFSMAFNFSVIVVRLTDIYSSSKIHNKPLIISLLKKLRMNNKIEIYNKKHVFNLIHVNVLNNFITKLLKKKHSSNYTTYKIYPKDQISLMELVQNLKKLTKSKSFIDIKKNKIKKNKKFKNFSFLKEPLEKDYFFKRVLNEIYYEKKN